MSKKIICIILFFASYCSATHPPVYISLTLQGIVNYNGHCPYGDCQCDITTEGNLNRKYALKLTSLAGDDILYWKGSSEMLSERKIGNSTDLAEGADILVIYFRTAKRLSITAKSKKPQKPDDCGLCDYFSSSFAYEWNFDFSIHLSANNTYQICSCSPWMSIPPWVAATGGQAELLTSLSLQDYAAISSTDGFNIKNLVDFCKQYNKFLE